MSFTCKDETQHRPEVGKTDCISLCYVVTVWRFQFFKIRNIENTEEMLFDWMLESVLLAAMIEYKQMN